MRPFAAADVGRIKGQGSHRKYDGSMCLYIYIYIYILHTYIYIYIYITHKATVYACGWVHMHVCALREDIFVNLTKYIAYMNLCMYVCLSLCLFICLFLCMYIRKHVQYVYVGYASYGCMRLSMPIWRYVSKYVCDIYIYIYIYNMSVYMKCPAFTAKKFGHIIYIYIYIYYTKKER